MGAVRSIPLAVPAPVVNRGPKSFSTKPETVQAIQFTDWGSAIDIFGFVDGFFYVPIGYNHPLRQEHEFDRGSDKVLSGASDFLVYKNHTGDDYRIELGSWIVSDESGRAMVYSDDQFTAKYTENGADGYFS